MSRCTPSGSRAAPQPQLSPIRLATPEGMVAIPAGEFLMGSKNVLAHPADGEGPVRTVYADAFRMDACAEFARFAADTGYRTSAERIGWSFVFAGLLPDDFPPTRGVVGAPWWRQAEGADWRRPDGPRPTWEDRADHPVVQVDSDDARAYCAWAGKRLPIEGGMGTCRPRRTAREGISLGRRVRAGRPPPNERVAGRLPEPAPDGRRPGLHPDSATSNAGFRCALDMT